MVLVSHKYKFIYIKNRKVASTSVESFFGKYCQNPNKEFDYTKESSSQKIDEYGIIGRRGRGIGNKWRKHKSASLIKEDLGENKFNKYIKFCVIRNPYDKMVSKYYWDNRGKEEKGSFKEFAIKYNCNNLDVHCIDGKSVCDYFIRYENLEEDIIKLCKILNIKDYDINDLPKFKSNVRKDKSHYSTFYDEETRKIVYEKHKKEFELFGYTFDYE